MDSVNADPMAMVLEMFRKSFEGQATMAAKQELLSTRVDALSSRSESAAMKQPMEANSYNCGSTNTQGTSGGKDGSMVPRYTKMDFPTYIGKANLLGWLTRCEQFFNHQKTSVEDWIGITSFHLVDASQLWFVHLEKAHPNLSWLDFKKFCNMRFGPPIHNNRLG